MSDTASVDAFEGKEPAPPRYVSFILRCQARSGGRVRARLLEVRSGFSCSVDDLDELPSIVRRQIARTSGPLEALDPESPE